jgi:D-alanyl-D-alanine carboxypeptidase/D-alanyl-D-alanine-endopeptidase (penicillin-binding protein 4)
VSPSLLIPSQMRSLAVVAVVAVVSGAALAGASPVREPPYQALARRVIGDGQGVFVRAADGTVLAAIVPDRAVHPASVSKIPTTLALLRRLGPDHRFHTRLVGTGPVRSGVLDGDLVVEASSDPFLVSEHALWMASELSALGIGRIAGRLVVSGPLLFNWRLDPRGAALRAVLTGRDGREAWASARATRIGLATTPVALRVLDGQMKGSMRTPLLEHRSPPLVRILKAFNCYSNNVFHPLSETIGGPAVVDAMARELVPEEARAGIRLDNAAGAGTTNRMSPRAAVELTDALSREAGRHGLALADLLPVAGIDTGTLRNRLDEDGVRGAVIAKTGTYGSVGACALAGTMETRRWGRVTFAVLNRGVPVPAARARQDAFVRAVLADAGANAIDYRPDPIPTLAAASLVAGR